MRDCRTVGMLFACVAMAGCGAKIDSTERSAAAISTAVAAGSYRLEAVTSDGYAIVSDLKAKTVNAVSLATKKVTPILATPLTDPRVLNVGATVLLWHDLNATADGAQLTAWSAATGAKLVSSNAFLDNFNNATISSDGQHLMFIEHVDANTDEIVLDTPSHAAPQILVKANSACPGHRARFVPGNTQRIVASYCTVGTAPPAGRTVSVFNLVAGTTTTLATGGADLFFRLDPTASRALVHNASGSSLVSLDGATSETIDATAVRGNFLPDGVELVYASGGALKRVAAGGLPETMQLSGANGTLGIMSDASAVFYFGTQNPDTGISDIYLDNLLVDGPRVVVNGDGTAALEAPSSDSRHVIFYNGADAAAHLGVFNTVAPSGGSIQRLGAGQSVINGDWELSNDRVVFNDQYVAATATVPEHVSLESIDFSQATPAVKLLATGADAAFMPTWDNTLAVYTTSDPTTGGLYTVAIP